MDETSSFNKEEQYLGSIRRVVGIASDNDAGVVEAACRLAQVFLSFKPHTISTVECNKPVFFLHILWCDSSSQGIEKTVEAFEIVFGNENPKSQIDLLNDVRNVLCSARHISSIREDLRDPGNLNNFINAFLLYLFFTSGNDLRDSKELNCLEIFFGEISDANAEEAQKAAANHLELEITNASIKPSESIFDALMEGRITIPNEYWR